MSEELEPSPSPAPPLPDEAKDPTVVLMPTARQKEGLSPKGRLVYRFEDDKDIDEIMVIGRTRNGEFILENTDFHDLFGLLGFVHYKILELIRGLR